MHSSIKACQPDDDDFHRPDDVACLPGGGMAFTCGPLWIFKSAKQRSATQLEPASAGATRLGTSLNSDRFIDRLYWTLDDGTIKSLNL